MSDKNIAYAPYTLIILFALVVFGTTGAAITEKAPLNSVTAITQLAPDAASETALNP